MFFVVINFLSFFLSSLVFLSILMSCFALLFIIYIIIQKVSERKNKKDISNIKKQYNYEFKNFIQEECKLFLEKYNNIEILYEIGLINFYGSTTFIIWINLKDEKKSTYTHPPEKLLTGDNEFDSYINIISHNKKSLLSKLSFGIRNKLKFIKNKDMQITIFDNKIKLQSHNIKFLLNKEFILNFIEIISKFSKNSNINRLLLNNALNDPFDKVRINNMKMLIGSKKAIQYKKELNKLKEDKLREISTIASYLLKEDDQMKLIDLIRSEDFDEIKTTLNYLSNDLSNEHTILLLCGLLFKFDNEEIIIKILNIIGKIENDYIKKQLLSFIVKKQNVIQISNKIRLKLFNYFEKYCVEESAGWIIDQLYTGDTLIDMRHIKSLDIFDMDIARRRENNIYDEMYDIKIDAISALGEFRNIEAVGHLKNFLKGKYHKYIKKSAHEAISKIYEANNEVYDGELSIIEKVITGKLSNPDNGKLSIK